jgi:hypothetical protein
MIVLAWMQNPFGPSTRRPCPGAGDLADLGGVVGRGLQDDADGHAAPGRGDDRADRRGVAELLLLDVEALGRAVPA